MLQNIQRKKTLCKLISATFMANSLGLPTAMAAEVEEEGLVVGDHSKDKVVDTSVSNPVDTDENGDPTIRGNDEDRNYPSWYFHEDGTPLSEAELKARNYKASYTSQEVASIYELLNTYGLAKVQKFMFNVSFRRNPDGSTTIDVNDADNHNPTKGVEPGTDAKGKPGPVVVPDDKKKPQANVPTDDPTTTPSDPKTTPTCDVGSELVGGVCMVKCAAGSVRDLKGDKLCHVTSCPADSIYNAEKTACTVCPTGTAPNAAQTECVTKPAVCGTNEIYADNNKTSCKACPTGTAPNASKTECVTVVCATNEIYTDANKTACKACPDGQVPNADQTACVTKPTDTCAADQIKKSDGTCEACPTGQQPNADKSACVYTQTCATGQSIKKDSNGKDVVDAKGNPVCETTKTDTCTATAGKELWKDKSGKENCVDTCDAEHVRDENTGACVTKKTDTCASNQIKKSDGTCETCPTGQQPNEAGTACVTPSKGGGGGGGNSLGKGLGGAAGVAALACLFSGNCSGGGGGTGGGDGEHPQKPGNKTEVVRNDVVSAKDLKVTFFTKDSSAEETEKGSPVLIAGQAPYYAKIHLGNLQNAAYGKLEKATFSIANVATGEIPFTSDQTFLFLKEGQGLPARANPYDGIISLTYRDSDGLAHVGQYHVPIYTSEMLNTLSADQQKQITAGDLDIEYMDAKAVSQLYMKIEGTIVLSATWKNGYCELKVNGGTIIGDGINDTITNDYNNEKYLTIADDNIKQEDCSSALENKKASFTRIALDYSINPTGELRSAGETQIGNTYYEAAEHSYEARKERVREMTENGDVIWPTLTQPGGNAYEHGTQIGWDTKNKRWVDYMGNPLNPEQVKIAEHGMDPDSESVKLTEVTMKEADDGTWHAVKSDGTEIDLDPSKIHVVPSNQLLRDAATYTINGTVSVIDTWENAIKNNNPINRDTKYTKDNINDFTGTSVQVPGGNNNLNGDETHTPTIPEIGNQAAKEVAKQAVETLANVVAGGAGTAMSKKTPVTTDAAAQNKEQSSGETSGESYSNSEKTSDNNVPTSTAPANGGKDSTENI
jgi:hypothetical protein